MSITLMSHVWECEIPPNLLLVLLAMADIARDDGSRCYPSIDYLAWKIGYTSRQVQRIVQELRKRDILLVVAYGKGGRGKATEYLIKLDHLDRKPSWAIVRQERDNNHDKMTPFSSTSHNTANTETTTSQRLNHDIPEAKPRHYVAKTTSQMSPQPLLNINDPLVNSLSDSREENKDEETPESSFWNLVLIDLQSRVTRPSFETWLTSTHCVQLSPDVATIEVASTVVRDMLNERMYSLISIACSKVPPHPSEVLFEVVRPQELEESL